MRVDVYSKYHVASIDPIPGTVVISIGSPGESYTLKDGWDDILRLEFDDVIKITDADTIHDFIERHTGKDFIIHCSAGVSRSVAVGSFMREVHDADLHLHETHSDEQCNSRVRRGLMRKYWNKQFS